MERLEFDRQNILKKEEREDAILKTQKVQLTFEITSEWFKGTMAVNVEKSRRFLQPFKDTLHEQEHRQQLARQRLAKVFALNNERHYIYITQ